MKVCVYLCGCEYVGVGVGVCASVCMCSFVKLGSKSYPFIGSSS